MGGGSPFAPPALLSAGARNGGAERRGGLADWRLGNLRGLTLGAYPFLAPVSRNRGQALAMY